MTAIAAHAAQYLTRASRRRSTRNTTANNSATASASHTKCNSVHPSRSTAGDSINL
jgi:hypothetical protein